MKDDVLKIKATDDEDLEVFATMLQDAPMPLAEVTYLEDEKRFAALFHRFTKSKLKLEDIEKMVGDKNEMHYSLEPKRTMQFADFLHSIGAIKNKPASWKDYYWENNYDQNGS